ELFTGLPDADIHLDSSFYRGQFSSSQAEFEANVFRYGAREVVKLFPGDARDNLCSALGEDGFAIAFIDVDIYQVTIDILRQLDAFAQGGEIIIVHDAWSDGVRKAIDEYKDCTALQVQEMEPEPGAIQLVLIKAT